MPTIAVPAGDADAAEQVGRDFAKEQIERWCSACDRFVLWEREHIIKGTPSAREQEDHKTSLKWLLRFTRLFQATVADPDFPDRSTADMLGVTLWKLEQSWRMICEPPPEG